MIRNPVILAAGLALSLAGVCHAQLHESLSELGDAVFSAPTAAERDPALRRLLSDLKEQRTRTGEEEMHVRWYLVTTAQELALNPGEKFAREDSVGPDAAHPSYPLLFEALYAVSIEDPEVIPELLPFLAADLGRWENEVGGETFKGIVKKILIEQLAPRVYDDDAGQALFAVVKDPRMASALRGDPELAAVLGEVLRASNLSEDRVKAILPMPTGAATGPSPRVSRPRAK